MDGYRVVRSQEVEFRDLDGLGHVNTAVYRSYLESANVEYFRAVLGDVPLEELGIVADVKIAFRSPAFFGETLAVGIRVDRIGTKSREFRFEIRGPERRLAEGSSVHVTFDRASRDPVDVPEEWRRRIEAHEAETVAA